MDYTWSKEQREKKKSCINKLISGNNLSSLKKQVLKQPKLIISEEELIIHKGKDLLYFKQNQ